MYQSNPKKAATIKELMDNLRAESMESIMDNDAAFDVDDFFSQDNGPWPKKEPINIPEHLKAEQPRYKSFKLSRRAEQIISEFLTFHLQVRQPENDLPEALLAQYNLLIRSDDFSRASALVEQLRKSLQLAPTALYDQSEAALLQAYDAMVNKRAPIRPSRPPELIPPGKAMIFIHNCQLAPMIDADLPTGSAIENSRKKCELYKNMWNEVFTYARNNPHVSLIVQGSNEVYCDTFRNNTELYHRVCGHHIFLLPATEEELYQDCIAQLKGSSFELGKGFERSLRAYFKTVYPKAELKSYAFVKDLITRIYTLYFCKQRSSRILTTDCIPKYNMEITSPEDILGQMDELIGLENVKKEFRDFYTMQLSGLAKEGVQRYHMLFTGNPGTGKTTIAKMTADLLFRMNILKTDKLVVAKPSDLMSMWPNGTSKKTSDVIRRAYDGVLFIDEAYGLANKDKGAEALNVLIQEMEENAHRLVVILAGYKAEIDQLLKINPGLASRIGRELHFEDYSLEELVKIFHSRCRKDGFLLDPSAEAVLEDCIADLMTMEYFGNARNISTLLQQLKEAWAREHYSNPQQQNNENYSPERVLYPKHFLKVVPPKKESSIDDLIGLETLKEKLRAFKSQVLYQRHLREKGISQLPEINMHMIFTGNPGTGKTSVAKLIADDLYSIGVLKSNRMVVAERKDLVSVFAGQTTQKTAEIVRKAVGGVLFIDEAYSLANDSLGHEVIEVLLTAMEEHKSDTVIIFAGYQAEMQTFLSMNPGIQSRIGYTFHFEDYSPEELTKMFEEKLTKAGFAVSPEALQKAHTIMEYFHSVKNFGNGRFVNHVLQQTITQRSTRDFTEQYRDISAEDIPDIKSLIKTAPNGMYLYDPSDITDKERLRTAVHELGHAIVMYETDPDNLPRIISIRNQAGSLGRVTFSPNRGNSTEQQLLNLITVSLGGKNAEKIFSGSHDTGCAGDIARAKQIAHNMLELYAMTTYGETEKEILAEADRLSMEILSRYKDALTDLSSLLLEKRQFTGEEFAQLLQKQ